MQPLMAGDGLAVGPRERRIETRDIGQDLEIAASQHGAAVGGAGRHPVAGRVFVAVDGVGGQREAEAGERPGRLVRVGDEPADMVEEDFPRGWGLRGGAQSFQTSSQLPRVAALEYSVARFSKKLVCSMPLSISSIHGSGLRSVR